jgi:hypothetical protein
MQHDHFFMCLCAKNGYRDQVMNVIRKMSVVIIVLLLLLVTFAVPVMAAGGNGGDGGSSGSDNPGGNSGSSGSDSAGGNSDSAGSGQEGPQSQQLLEEQARKQQETVEQPGIQINQQDRDQDQSRTNISSAEEQATADLIRQQDRDYFFDQVKEQEQNLLHDRDQDRDQVHIDVALYALSISANVSGSSEPQLTRLAAEVNSSYADALKAEQQIQNRDSFSRTLFGGDQQAAGLLLQNADQNQQRLSEMNQLLMNCSDCDPQVRVMLEEQVKVLSQEQNRLTVLAQQEQRDKGLFGWLFS